MCRDELLESRGRFFEPFRLRRRINPAASHSDQRDGPLIVEHILDVRWDGGVGFELVEVVKRHIVITTIAQTFEKLEVGRLGMHRGRDQRDRERAQHDADSDDARKAEAVPNTSHIHDILARGSGGRCGDRQTVNSRCEDGRTLSET